MRRPPSAVELGFWEAEVEAGGSFVAGPPPGAGAPGQGRDGLRDCVRSGTVGGHVGGGVTVLCPGKDRSAWKDAAPCSVESTPGGAYLLRCRS